MIVGISVAGVLLIVIAVFTVIFCKRRRAKVGDEVLEAVSSDDADKPRRKDLMEEDSIRSDNNKFGR